MDKSWLQLRDASTALVHLGRALSPGSPVNEPVMFSSTFVAGTNRVYGRTENPVWIAFEEVIGAIEGGSALSFASGMAAISAVFETFATGAKIVIGDDTYMGTRQYLEHARGRGRFEVAVANVRDYDGLRAVADGAAAILIESPSNPLLNIVDIARVSEIASSLGTCLIVDNTFATPVLQHPLSLGADVVVHSATKFIAGHSDVLSGVVVTSDLELLARVANNRANFGSVPGPMESFLALRGARTLHLRVIAAQDNALRLSNYLLGRDDVERVLYPGLDGHQDADTARSQMAGPGAMMSFVIRGGQMAADVFCDAVEIATNATSLGGVETLLERRGRHRGEEATPPGLIRVSVGIESYDDLETDFARAFAAVERAGLS